MFGIDIIDAGLLPGMLVAFLAGILSFLSPCVLPVVPPYLAYMSGISATELTDKSASKSAVLPALFFVLGLSTVFLLLGFTASAFGLLFLSYQSSFNTLAGLLVMLILSLAASEASIARGTILLAVYALGLGLPFLLVAAFLSKLTVTLGWMKRHMQQIERIMGLLLWTIGLLMLTGGFSDLSYWLLERFPALGALG